MGNGHEASDAQEKLGQSGGGAVCNWPVLSATADEGKNYEGAFRRQL